MQNGQIKHNVITFKTYSSNEAILTMALCDYYYTRLLCQYPLSISTLGCRQSILVVVVTHNAIERHRPK